MKNLIMSTRICILKEKVLTEPRYVSIEQAKIITDTYKANEGKPRILTRALALKAALEQLEIHAEPEELVVGNRTEGVRQGVVFPESGISWIDQEFESLPGRAQDPFQVRQEDIAYFREVIKPYWKGKSLEDVLRQRCGSEIDRIAKVVKINQKDHAQGHICPDCSKWLHKGPAGIRQEADQCLKTAVGEQKIFYESVSIVMTGAIHFMGRYQMLLEQMAQGLNVSYSIPSHRKTELLELARICGRISEQPPETFHEAVQSLWFLFVILHMESNASSFSPGRLDELLWEYYDKDRREGRLDRQGALEIIECLWIKFNEIVYMRNRNSAKYFAGFPIGFNVAVGGQDKEGRDFVNELSFLMLKAQEHLGMPQPNLSVRLHRKTGDELLKQALLYDFYGELLTKRQQQIYESVVLEDYSLSEVAEELNISRQGVHDMIRRCDKALEGYEEKLHLVEKFVNIRGQVQKIHELASGYHADDIEAISNVILEEL